MVPWNEVVVLDDVVMTVSGKETSSSYEQPQSESSQQSHVCLSHDYDHLKPVVMSTWQRGFQGDCPDIDAILVETQAIQESVQIPGTGLYLVYHSSR